MYKVFLNTGSQLILTQTGDPLLKESTINVQIEPDPEVIRKQLSDASTIVKVGRPLEFMRDIFDDHEWINAGGGIVKNPSQKLLVIKRNGKWDLPKGKLEQGESPKEGAIREVEEECGLTNLECTGDPLFSFHTYLIGDQPVMKKTYWFPMICTDEHIPVPQLEEGITEVKWINADDLPMVLANTYESIADLLERAEVFNQSY